MKYRIAIQLVASICCVVISGLVLGWWAIVLWIGVFLYLATAMELVYKGARAAAAPPRIRATEPPPDRPIPTRTQR